MFCATVRARYTEPSSKLAGLSLQTMCTIYVVDLWILQYDIWHETGFNWPLKHLASYVHSKTQPAFSLVLQVLWPGEIAKAYHPAK